MIQRCPHTRREWSVNSGKRIETSRIHGTGKDHSTVGQKGWEENRLRAPRKGLHARLYAMWSDPMMKLPGPLFPNLLSGANTSESQGVMRTHLWGVSVYGAWPSTCRLCSQDPSCWSVFSSARGQIPRNISMQNELWHQVRPKAPPADLEPLVL